MTAITLPHGHSEHGHTLMENQPEDVSFEALSALYRQLSDPVRLRLFWILCHCEECVIDLSAMMGMSSPALSHHLKLLKSAGLILSRRGGKEVYYRAADTREAELLHDQIESLMALTCPVVKESFGKESAVSKRE